MLNQHTLLLITPSVKFPSVTVSASVTPLLHTHLCRQQESDTLHMSPFRAPQRDQCRGPAPYPRVLGADSGRERAMATDDAEGLVAFQDVRVIRSTAPALLCQIGDRSVWLPRGHISGKLWCRGDRGTLLIRRWIACERRLIDIDGVASGSPPSSTSRPRSNGLHLVRGDRNTQDAT